MSNGIGLAGWLEQRARAIGLRFVDDPVDPAAYEVTAILSQLEPEGSPPVLFRSILAANGQQSQWPVLFNAYASLPALGAMLDVPSDSWTVVLDAYLQKVDALSAPVEVPAGAVHQNIVRGEDVDLRVLPWTRHVEGEGGVYFTPIIASRSPGAGRYNLSWNRAMYLGPRHLSVHISPRQFWSFQREAEEAGEDLPVAVVLGHHPAFNLTAAALTPMSIDEYDVAGALLGAPLAVCPAVTFGRGLMIPAEAEVILEGRVLAGRRVVEGPFGEYMRYLGPQKLSHVVEIDAITWRDGAVITEVFAGHRDHLNAHVSIHASLLATARAAIPQVTRVAWFEGGGPTTAVIALKKSAEGQQVRAALAILAASNIIKKVILVDDDIDVFDAQQVMWAISTRVRAAQDIHVVEGLQGNLLDPSDEGYGSSSAAIVDATWPMDGTAAPVAKVPDEAVGRFPVSHYSISQA